MWNKGVYIPEGDYEYFCPDCGNETDLPYKEKDSWTERCPNCNAELKRTIDQ